MGASKAPSLRAPVAGLAEGDQNLGAAVGHYVARVRRLEAGDVFVGFDPARGIEAEVQILEVGAQGLRVRVGPIRASSKMAHREVTWVQGLPKGDKMDAIVRDATELGVTAIVPASTEFSVVRLDGDRQQARRARWERIAVEASRQCGRADVPVIHDVVAWSRAITIPASGAGFCLHERATAPLGPVLASPARTACPLVFASGPEGGLSNAEVEEASAAGFVVVLLGPFVLRAETVAAATLGALRALEAT